MFKMLSIFNIFVRQHKHCYTYFINELKWVMEQFSGLDQNEFPINGGIRMKIQVLFYLVKNFF